MAGYGSDEGFDDYVTENGYTVAAGTVAAARSRGSAYIDAAYGYRFVGVPTGGSAQERAWPRSDAVDIYGDELDENVVPDRVVKASYEAAILELNSPGSLSILISENEKIRRLKAGSVEIEYAESKAYNAVEGAYPMSTAINGLLLPLIGGTSRPLPAILVV